MGCKCCKKKDQDDDEFLVRQSPLICEDLEKPVAVSHKVSKVTELSPAEKPGRKGSSKNPQERETGQDRQAKATPTPPDPGAQARASDEESPENTKTNLEQKTQPDKVDPVQPSSPGLRVSTVKSEEDKEKPSDESMDKTTRESIVSKTPDMVIETDGAPTASPPQSPSSVKSGGLADCIKGNPFLDNPIDCSDKTLADLENQEFVDFLVQKMEDAMDLFNTVMDQGTKGYSVVSEDKNNESGFDLRVFAQTVGSTKKSKIHATKQSFKIKAKPEEFIYVANDQDIQTKINSNLSMYKNLFVYKTEDFLLEIFHTKSKKFMMIDSRESVYVKFCKRITDKHILSIGKSILLGGISTQSKETTTNMMLTGFAYKYIDDEPTNAYSQVEVYNCTDFCSTVGLTLLRPVISKNVKDMVKKNMEEVESLRSKNLLNVQLFASKS